MPALVNFSDFIKATDEKVVTPTTEILNEAVYNTYLMREMVRGQGNDRVFGGGSKLTDRIMLEDNGSFAFFEPGEEANPTVTDQLVKIEVNWRFARCHYGWSDAAVVLNEGDQETQYKKLKKDYEQAAHTSMFNGMEEALFAYPSATAMEAASGKVAYSLAAFIDEIGTDHHWPGFSTIMGVDPATEERWRNKIATYDSDDPFDETEGIIAGMDDLFLQVKYESPETASDYFESDTLRKMKILTNRNGAVLYKQALRRSNDRLVSPQDPAYNQPVYSGIPVKYIAVLDSALLDQEAAVTGTPAPWATGEPRYYFFNFNYVWPAFQKDRYMWSTGPIIGGIRQPDSWAVYKFVYYNLFLRSRQRQGILTPVGHPTEE